MSTVNPATPGLNHLCLAVKDLPASLAVYDVGLGLQHLAFNAASREMVDAVHQRLRELGAAITEAPAEYPQDTPRYYAVFFKDPSGIQLEVCPTPDMEL
jgi:catechol 2,3-dioxygenase-like lactoylglutathione lyase family enzyme